MPFIEAAGIGATPQQPSSTGGLGDLDSDAFLQLLVAQMRHQDPMAPSDHTAMLQQTSQFTQVEALQRVTEMQQQLLGLSQATMAADLVGKDVTAHTGDGEAISGTVDAIRFTADGPVLAIGEHEVPFASATEIRAPGTELESATVRSSATDPEIWSGPWSLD